jgi:uncharacterized protein
MHKDAFLSKYPIQSIAIFGSYARNSQTENSDVDVLVEFNGVIGSAFIDLANELENVLGIKTDVVSKRAIKPKYFDAIQPDLIYV